MKRKLTDLERDNLRRQKKCRAECEARCNRQGRAPDGFADRERAYAEAHPHLMEQRHCGLYPDSDRPARRVVCPNGVVLYSSWYKVPTTDADHTKAYKEAQWLLGGGHLKEIEMACEEAARKAALDAVVAEAKRIEAEKLAQQRAFFAEAHELLQQEAA